jgi:ketosteroid isomerase-like protein
VSSENVDLVKRLIDIFNSSDSIYALADFLAPDVEFYEPPEQPGSSVLRGREAALAAFAAFDEAWEEHRTRPTEVKALDEERVLMLTVELLRGRDGLKFEQPVGAIITLRAGQVVRYEAFWTPERALQAAGLRD